MWEDVDVEVQGNFDPNVKFGRLSVEERDLIQTMDVVIDSGISNARGSNVLGDSALGNVSVQDGRVIAERIGMAGVDELSIVLRYLPKEFLVTYLMLIDRGVGERNLGSGGGVAKDGALPDVGGQSAPRLKTSSYEHVSSASRSGASTSPILMNSERSIDYRRKVDRQIRKIIREIKLHLASESEKTIVSRVCSGKCKRRGDAEFLYCPNCGGPMVDLV